MKAQCGVRIVLKDVLEGGTTEHLGVGYQKLAPPARVSVTAATPGISAPVQYQRLKVPRDRRASVTEAPSATIA